MWWAAAWGLAVVGLVVLGRLLLPCLVSYLCARWLGCSRVVIGKFGFFTLSHLRVIFGSHLSLVSPLIQVSLCHGRRTCVQELDQIQLSTSFFNHENS